MARIDPMLMNSVCLLTDTDSKPLATSFLYGYPSDDGDEPGFAGWLVTCKHVVYDEKTQIISAPISVKHAPRITNDSCRHGQARVQWPCYR